MQKNKIPDVWYVFSLQNNCFSIFRGLKYYLFKKYVLIETYLYGLICNSVFLGADTAVSLGIIINEFFTNSAKYAFPQGRGGEIKIELFREKASTVTDEKENPGKISIRKGSGENERGYEQFTLVFADNGKGIPEELDIKNPQSLGLQLVNALVNQIEGSLELKRENGTEFWIKFRDTIRTNKLKNEQV